MSDIILSTPRVVRQASRHICWAAAYESWAEATNSPTSIHSAQNMIDLLRPIGQNSPDGPVLDQNERLLPDGVGLFAQLANMRLVLVSSKHMSAGLIRRKLGDGHIWLWGTPTNGHVAHVVVVYGIETNGNVLMMDPLAGLSSNSVHHLRLRFRIFGVGTPLLSSTRSSSPFAGLTSNAPVHAPSGNPLYPGI